MSMCSMLFISWLVTRNDWKISWPSNRCVSKGRMCSFYEHVYKNRATAFWDSRAFSLCIDKITRWNRFVFGSFVQYLAIDAKRSIRFLYEHRKVHICENVQWTDWLYHSLCTSIWNKTHSFGIYLKTTRIKNQ